MKIAITSTGNDAGSKIDSRFGRCAYFAFYDTESKQLDFVVNTSKDAAEGAGPAAVAVVANHRAEKIVSGEFGFKIKGMLNDLNIQMIMVKEDKTVEDIVRLLEQQAQ